MSALEVAAAATIVILLGVLATGGSSALPLVGDLPRISEDVSSDSILWIVGLIGAFFVLRAIVYLAQSYLQNHLAYRTSALIASRLFRGYLQMDYADYVRRHSSEMIRNAHESTIGLAAHVLFPGILLVAEGFVALALSIVLVVVAPSVALATFSLLIVLVILVLRFVQPRLLRLGRALQADSAESLRSLQQSLHGLRDIRVFGREHFFAHRFEEIRLNLASTYGGHGLLIDVPRIALETGVLLALLVFLVVQVTSSASFEENFSVLALMGYAAFRMLPSINRIVNGLQSIRYATPIIDLLYADLRWVPSRDSLERLGGNDEQPLPFHVAIELQNVSYRYPDARDEALTDLSLQIEKGELIGIIGRTGSGKSTLLDIILGLLTPDNGLVLVDGQPIDGKERPWCRNLGVVPQTVFLLDDTIERNVALGISSDEIDGEALRDAIRIAQLDEFVAHLPEGVQTIVGERGVRLSGGQRQRVAIARAMYTRPKVLVLDEGLSALDSRTEAELIAELARTRGEMTIISVAHRASTIRNCDRVIALEGGRIFAEGRFDELVRTNDDVAALMREPSGEDPVLR